MCQRNRELIDEEERLERLEKMEEVFVKLREEMMAESGSIDSVEYVMYNYSVSDLNYSFVRYIFPIHRSDPI